ncbi:HPr family phosphocarrier protein [Murdochiella massiliensis]|uniref:HPr family phosphocarrier protein n=1 Tax=Murdochiella massiliensis TaxID=1673723 RepID=UPI00082CDDFA|nr:HPr family phosphocarrier protein [Murdochiella massiliensis]MBY0583919.1 HPr family phosphocarrier protein [Murdochiella sp. Marseille-P8839]
MVEEKVVLDNDIGLMGRPAANFIQTAKKFLADVYLERDHKVFNGKSIMSVLSMGAGKGAKFTLRTDGPDEKEALEALLTYLKHDITLY